MPIEFKIDMWSIKKKTLQSAKNTVIETTNAVYMDVRKFSPIDTWKYLSWHRNKGIRVDKNRIIWEVENVLGYSERVEKGFRRTAVNWNLKSLWQIYFSKGANVYAKAIAKNKDTFIKKLRWQ